MVNPTTGSPADDPAQDALIIMEELPRPHPTPNLPILAQGDSAPLLELLDAQELLQPVLEENKMMQSRVEGIALLVEASDKSLLRTPQSNIPSQKEINTYNSLLRSRTKELETTVSLQDKIMVKITNLIQKIRPRNPTPPPSTIPDDDIDTNGNTGSDKRPFVKVPESVTRFGKSGTKNAIEFLRTFAEQIEATATNFDPNDGVTLGRYLSQVIEDVNQKNAFTHEFVLAIRNAGNRRLTSDETNAIFLKHCAKTSDHFETSRRLLTLTPKSKELFTEYGKRAAQEMRRSGTSDHCPAIVSYLDSSIPPAACTDMRLQYLIDHLYTLTGHELPQIPNQHFLQWYKATQVLEGYVEDYGTIPARQNSTVDQFTARIDNKRSWHGQTSHKGYKKQRMDQSSTSTSSTQPAASSSTSVTSTSTPKSNSHNSKPQCGRCGWSNHSMDQCRAPLCFPCQKYHFEKHCPLKRGKSSSHTGIRNSATGVSTNAMIDTYKGGTLDDEYDAVNVGASLYPSVRNSATDASTEYIDNDNRPTVTVLFNGVEYRALLDTGCTHTMIDTSLVKEHNIPVQHRPGTILLGRQKVTTPRNGTTIPITVQCNGRQRTLEMEVLDLPSHDFQIGMDRMHEFGFGVSGLPTPTPSFPTTFTIPDTKPCIVPADEVHELEHTPSFKADKARALEYIQPALSANAAIPLNSSCPVPEMKVYLTVPENTIIHRRQRPFAESEQHVVDEQVQRWLDEGVVCLAPAGTPHNSPLTLAPKKDLNGNKTGHRVCLDPRQLNLHLPDDNFPLPLVSDIMNKIAGHAVFSTLDLRQAYHRLPVNEEDRAYTTFSHRGQQYMFQRAPFGLKHISSLFQRGMSRILGDLPFVGIFIDDIVVYSDSIEEHKLHLRTVINRLTQARLILNPDKCHFFCTKIALLGHIIDVNGKQIDPKKIVNMNEWDYPTTGKQVQQYLGFFNFFREYIPCFSTLAAPLDGLRNNTKPFVLNELQRECFDSFKTLVAQAPILSFPDFEQPFYVATDASNVGVGAVLYQLPHGEEHPEKVRYISFMARALQTSERNYSATKKEMLAIAFALTKFHYYLKGRKFTLFTDHRALTFLFTQKQPSIVMAGWQDIILEFDFNIVYRPGVLNVLPDHLSRLFPSSLWPQPHASHASSSDTATFRASSPHHPLQPEPHTLPGENITVCYTHIMQDDDLKRTRAEVPESKRQAVLSETHDMGHPGAHKMIQAIHGNNLTWPKLLQDCLDYVKGCRGCQRYNITRKGYHPLRAIHAELPGDHIAIDLAGPLTPPSVVTDSRGNERTMTYILVIVDVCTRFVYLRALVDKSALTVAEELFKVFCDIGFPKIIQSDNGTEFVNQVLHALTEQMQVKHRLITPYHPRSNGLAERNVQTSIGIIKKRFEDNITDWAAQVPVAQLAMNTRTVDLHHSSPYSLFFARRFNGIGNFEDTESNLMNSDKLLERLEYMTKVVFPAASERAKATQQDMIRKFNATVLHNIFPDGAAVMALDPIRNNKLDPKYEGPFTVVKQDRNGSYTLRDKTGDILKRKYVASQLKLALAEALDPNAYVIASVLKHRPPDPKVGRLEHQYRVRWKGYSPKDDTWEPYSHFYDTQCIRNFWKTKRKTCPHPENIQPETSQPGTNSTSSSSSDSESEPEPGPSQRKPTGKASNQYSKAPARIEAQSAATSSPRKRTRYDLREPVVSTSLKRTRRS